MCYWVGTRKVREIMLKQLQQDPEDEISRLFYRSFIEPPQPENALQLMEHPVAIGKAEPVLTTMVKDKGELQFRNMRWTLQWNYWDSKTKAEKPGRPLLNSICENVFWQHKDLIYTKRCLIPVDGYWEFYHFKGKTYPIFIYPADEKLFYLAGIYNELADKNNGEIIDTFSIITTPPNSITAMLHNNPSAHDEPRMLCIVDEKLCKEYLNEDLKTEDIKRLFFKPLETERMKYHTTVRFLKKENAGYLSSEKVQERFEYEEVKNL